MVYFGFAKSFGIDDSNLGGLGVGINIFKGFPKKYLNINTMLGYSKFNYVNVTDVEGMATTVFIAANTTVFKTNMELNWELHAFYLPDENIPTRGGKNTIRLSVPIHKGISFTTSHNYVYNSHVDTGISKVNTFLLFGLSFKK